MIHLFPQDDNGIFQGQFQYFEKVRQLEKSVVEVQVVDSDLRSVQYL